VDYLELSKVRSARQDSSALPISALGALSIPNMIASGRVSLGVKEDQCNKISEITIKLGNLLSNDEWEINDISISVQSYTDNNASFSTAAF
jgi:hypothetical protein